MLFLDPVETHPDEGKSTGSSFSFISGHALQSHERSDSNTCWKSFDRRRRLSARSNSCGVCAASNGFRFWTKTYTGETWPKGKYRTKKFRCSCTSAPPEVSSSSQERVSGLSLDCAPMPVVAPPHACAPMQVFVPSLWWALKRWKAPGRWQGPTIWRGPEVEICNGSCRLQSHRR